MIDTELADFITGAVMIVAAVDVAGRPGLARAVGARLRENGALELLFSRAQWGPTLDGLSEQAPLAVTFSRPADYRTFQLKGAVIALAPADDVGAEIAANYVMRMSDALGRLGVPQPLRDQWFVTEDLISLIMRPDAVFAQTPGPGAGTRMQRAS